MSSTSQVQPGKKISHLQEYLDEDSLAHYSAYPGVERVEYDFTGERVNRYTVSIPGSIFHLTMSCLGAGIMVIHVGFMRGGLWTSLVATFVLGLIVSHCMMMLVKSAQAMYGRLRVPALSYSALAELAALTGPHRCLRKHAKLFRFMVDTTLFTEMSAILCIYQMLIATTFKQALEFVLPEAREANYTDRIYLLIVAVPLVLISLIRGLKVLAPISIVSLLFIGVCVFTTVYYSISEWQRTSTTLHTWTSVEGFCEYLGICLFSINGVDITLAVENNMQRPRYFAVVLEYSMAIVLICVAAIGFLGYWSWGDHCRGPFTIHMTLNTITVVLQFILSAVLCTIFAVQLWAPFRIAWHYLGRNHLRFRRIWETFYRILHVGLITGVCVAYPNMSKMMMFFGNFFAAHIAFVYPPIIESLVTWNSARKGIRWRLLKHIFLIMLGLTFNALAFYVMFL